jgi:hypothetical protein
MQALKKNLKVEVCQEKNTVKFLCYAMLRKEKERRHKIRDEKFMLRETFPINMISLYSNFEQNL